MEVSYTITFTPQEKKDYHYDLICATEREKFVIPINAAGLKGKDAVSDGISPCDPAELS
jgi:hydrocephalus-inducing protein